MERSHRSCVVVFDLGEVLATPTTLMADLAAELGVGIEAMTPAYWAGRNEHDRGSATVEYWSHVAAELGIAMTTEQADRLAAIDAEAWATIRPDAAELLADLDAKGLDLAILSNAPHPMAQAARASGWGRHIDAWFFSAEFGIAKPDVAIYAAVTEALQAEPSRIVFFDDRQVNVDAARAAGWDAHLWTSGESTREALLAFGIL